jgi:Uncharacterized protein conserved in bacteria
MLSEYTEDLASLFTPDVEAVYFRSSKELIKKLSELINNQNLRNSISLKGFEKVYAAKHDVKSRLADSLLPLINQVSK